MSDEVRASSGVPSNLDDARFKTAFPALSAKQLKALEQFGTITKVAAGEHVWHAGDRRICMFVVVSGVMHVVDGRTGTFVADHGPGNFSGDVDVLSGRPSVVAAIAATDMELLEVPGECVRSIVAEVPELGDVILKAFLMRRALLLELNLVGPLVIGSRYSADTLRIREFLFRNSYPYIWEDLESKQETRQMLDEFQVGPDETPVVVLADGTLMRVPSNRELASAIGISRAVESKIYDVVIVGAGPAGLAAAVYGASEGLSTLVIDSEGPGGQAGTSSRIENYMGFPLGLSGHDLADRAVSQATRFGAQMIVPGTVTNVTCNELGGHQLHLEGDQSICAKCVILATGAAYRRLEVDDLSIYEGRGVYYSATNVERVLCSDSSVAVVGAGNSAGQAAVFMSEGSRHVFLIVRGDDLRKSMSSYLALRIERSDRISVLVNSEICALQGDAHIEGAVIRNRATGETRTEGLSGVFVLIGAVPNTGWIPDTVEKDEKGFIMTGSQLVEAGKWKYDRQPFYLETSCPGVFAVGDARSSSVKRVASAVGEGSMAVAFVHQYLAL